MDCLTDLTTLQIFILSMGSLGLGILLLIRGGDWTIDSSVYVVRHYGVSPAAVGATIIAFGTSFPELIVSLNANMAGSPGIAIGNVLGSNIANIILIIGVAALFTTIKVNAKNLMSDIVVLLLATVFLTGMMLYGFIGQLAGAGMLAAVILFTVWQYRKAHAQPAAKPDEAPEFKSLTQSVFILVGGLLLIALGAEFLVRGAQVSARIIGVPEAVIALSIIAIGTSLPELSTSLIACKKGQSELAIGNIFGSNIYNILLIIGAVTMIKPIDVGALSPQLIQVDIWVTLAVAVLFSAVILIFKQFNKWMAMLFLVAYMAYIVSMYLLNMA